MLPVICLSSDFLVDYPSPDIDSVERPRVLVEVLEQKVNKTLDYESKRKFQVSWAAKLPWVELQMGVDGCVHLVKCKICLEVEQKNKLLVPKWDSLQKHTSQRKAEKNMKGVKKSE